MLKLDHISVIAPSLAEGVSHVRACLDLDVPFGQRHAYMGPYNHLLQLGDRAYKKLLEDSPEKPDSAAPLRLNSQIEDRLLHELASADVRKVRSAAYLLGSTRTKKAAPELGGWSLSRPPRR